MICNTVKDKKVRGGGGLLVRAYNPKGRDTVQRSLSGVFSIIHDQPMCGSGGFPM